MHSTCTRMALIKKKTDNSKCWRGSGEVRTLTCYWGNVCLLRPLQKDTHWQDLKNLPQKLSVWPSSSVLGIERGKKDVSPLKGVCVDACGGTVRMTQSGNKCPFGGEQVTNTSYPLSGTSFIREGTQTTDKHYGPEEPQSMRQSERSGCGRLPTA